MVSLFSPSGSGFDAAIRPRRALAVMLELDGVIAPVDRRAERHHRDARALVVVDDLDAGVKVSMRAPGAGARDLDRRRRRIRRPRDALRLERFGERAGRQDEQQCADEKTIGAKHGHLPQRSRFSS